MPLTVVQMLPALEGGGVERGTLEVARELVRCGHRALVIAAPGRLAQAIVEAGAEQYSLGGGGEVRARPALPRPAPAPLA